MPRKPVKETATASTPTEAPVKVPVASNSSRTRRKTTNTTPAVRKVKHKALWLFSIFVLLVIIVICAVRLLEQRLFSSNDRFIVHKLNVNSTGYWSSNDFAQKLLLNILNIKLGSTNSFALDLEELRNKLCSIPSIDSATIERVLPDSLELHIVERVPVAVLNSVNSGWVVDGEGVVMNRAQTVASKAGDLPTLRCTNLPSLSSGLKLTDPKILAALELLEATRLDYPDLRFRFVNVGEKELGTKLVYRENNTFTVLFPSNNPPPPLDYRERLLRLQSAIEQSIADPALKAATINMCFDKSVVLQ